MANTYNFTDGSIDGVRKPHDTTPEGFEVFVLKNFVDCTKQNVGSGETAAVLNIPAGVLVLEVQAVASGDTDAATVSLGLTDGDVDLFMADAVIASGAAGVPIPTHSTYFAAADTIDMLIGTATADTLKLEVVALCIKMDASIDGE